MFLKLLQAVTRNHYYFIPDSSFYGYVTSELWIVVRIKLKQIILLMAVALVPLTKNAVQGLRSLVAELVAVTSYSRLSPIMPMFTYVSMTATAPNQFSLAHLKFTHFRCAFPAV
jgi:hypothetical protein